MVRVRRLPCHERCGYGGSLPLPGRLGRGMLWLSSWGRLRFNWDPSSSHSRDCRRVLIGQGLIGAKSACYCYWALPVLASRFQGPTASYHVSRRWQVCRRFAHWVRCRLGSLRVCRDGPNEFHEGAHRNTAYSTRREGLSYYSCRHRQSLQIREASLLSDQPPHRLVFPFGRPRELVPFSSSGWARREESEYRI